LKERIIRFVTDLPKSPKDMAERLKKVPLWYKGASLITVASLVACQLGEKFGFVTPPPEGTKTPPPTETVPPNSFPIATAATEINSYGQYEFIEQSEIEANLKEPYEHFKNNPDVKALFNDSGTIEYSAMGIRVYLQGGGHTNYIFFEASSETEEKGYIAMVFGGGQPGEISYSVLNRIVDSNGMVGLGLTSDIGGNRLENPVMIFNTGLTEKEISQLTADDLLKRDILFIPGGVKVPSERIIGAKPLFSLLPVEPTPTPELIKMEEHDLNPAYTETVLREFMGVKINAELITDQSLDPEVTKVTVSEKAYTEFIARIIFKVWWKKGEMTHSGIATEEDFKVFMELWQKAQESNDPTNWQKVQINNIWANDLNDGNGYIQKPYTIWPMYEGEAPEGVRGIDKIAVALVNGRRVKNLTLFDENPYDIGLGTNLDGKTLFMYGGLANGVYRSCVKCTASGLGTLAWWLNRNSGGRISGYGSGHKDLSKILLNGGLEIYP